MVLGTGSVLAQDYTPLAPIPQLTNNAGNADINTLVPALVKLAISVAAALAVIMMILGGIEYMSTDIWTKKNDAKGRITNALVGFLLAISAYTILYTVNPKLVDIDFSILNVATSTASLNTLNLSNRTAAQTGCVASCVEVKDVPIKPTGACLNQTCYVDSALLDKLKTLDQKLKAKNLTWQVTEAFPPTVQHADNCHKPNNNQSGKCVDAALFSPTNPNVLEFLKSIKEVFGTNFAYERCDQNNENPLKNNPQFSEFRDQLKCYGTTNAQHAHINL